MGNLIYPMSTPHRPVRTFWPDGHILGQLTDRRLNHYILTGRYGPALQRRMERGQEILDDRERRRAAKRAERPAPPPKSLINLF